MRNTTLSSATMLGTAVTVLGVMMLRMAGGSTLSTWLGVGVILLGFGGTVVGLVSRPAPLEPRLPTQPIARPPRTRDETSDPIETVKGENGHVARLANLLMEFRAWCEGQDTSDETWPAFDRWMRDSLHQLLGARRVRCYHVQEGRPVPLTQQNEEVLSTKAWSGLLDHVLATGRRYVHGSPSGSDMIAQLAASLPQDAPQWLMPVRFGGQTVGLLVVGELDARHRGDPTLMQLVADLVELFWRQVQVTAELASARETDRISGVLDRLELSESGHRLLAEAAREGEPAVVLALALEGVRRLDDSGRWEQRDWLMQQVGRELRRRLRSDDLIGRFSDDRFVAVLRRLDLTLGQMIASKVLDAVNAALAAGDPTLPETVRVRCGLAAASGRDYDASLVAAFRALQQGRTEGRVLTVASN